MSGATAMVAGIVAAAAGVGSMTYGIVNGQNQQQAQQKALATQNQAQQTAEANALSTQRKDEVAQDAVNQQKPNVASILARAAQMGNMGLSSTMLTGPNGSGSGMSLGKATLLGS